MGESNGAWGDLARYDDELAEAFDGFSQLPEAGVNAVLDAFCERKNLDVPALVRLGARLTDTGALAFGFPGGIKFRDMVTDSRWSYVGSVFKELKIVRAREPSAVVIVAEGETDGARLSMLYPNADIAVLPAGADPRPHTKTYASQLNDYGLVLLGQDHDVAGDRGADELAAALTVPSRRWLAPGDDWAASLDAPPLPAPPEIVRAGALVFEDLRPILDGGLPPLETIVDDLVYVSGVHWFQGHPGSGKTTLAMAAAWDVMSDLESPRHVVWLDYEGGVRGTLRRMIEMGIPAQLLIERLHYTAWPVDANQYLNEVADQWPGALVVVDSASKALQTAALDENSATDVTKWVGPVVRAAKERGLPVIVIDHVTKAAGESRYARGAGAKLADSDVAWRIEAHEPFNRTTKGIIHCSQAKDRDGSLPWDVWYSVGDGEGGIPVDRIDDPRVEEAPQTAGSEDVAI